MKNFLWSKKLSSGQSLVELLLAISLSAILLPVLLTGFVGSREGKSQNYQRTEAVLLLRTTVEAVRSIREKDWNLVSANGVFHPEISGSSWILIPGSDTINGFTRKIDIESVNRDESGAIASSGILDSSTKKIIVKVSWGADPQVSSIEDTLYISRYLSNNAFIETTVSDFTSGIKTGTTITNVSGGEVSLGAGGYGDWCAPNLSIAALDLPKSGVANAISAYEGRAIAGTGENASGVSLADVAITNTDPPIASMFGTFNGYKTNDVFINGDYAYIATDSNSKEVVIVNLITHLEIGYYNTPTNSDATSVYVLGTKGYVTAGFYLYIFDLSSQSGSRPQVGNGFFFLGSATSVAVNGNYAYVSLASSFIEMQIIDISNPQSLQNTGWANVNGTDAKRVFVNQTATRAYLATGADTSRNEFFIIDISQKTGPRPTLGSYNANGMNPKSLTVVTGNKAILVGAGGEEYQVIDISNEAILERCGGLNIDSGIKGISSVLEQDGDAYSYIVTGDGNAEFKIIEGGPGGIYSLSGTFESSAFDAFNASGFNRFDVSVNRPSQTDIYFQLGSADAVSGSCGGASFNYAGPDGTSFSYFTTSVTLGNQSFSYVIPFSLSPKRCFKYKAYLSGTDVFSTPILYDATINYSP